MIIRLRFYLPGLRRLLSPLPSSDLRHSVCLVILVLGIFLSTPACAPYLAETKSEATPIVSADSPEVSLEDEFRRFSEIYGGTESLGQPVTSLIIVDGWRVQYFEKARLEYHPENEAAYRITVGWLGELLHRRNPPLPPSTLPKASASHSRYFAETGHTLSGDFLAYFDSHGGSVRFGLPISEPFIENGRLTQDLQSARFFWDPQLDPPVILEDIGLVHLETVRRQNKR